MTKQRKDPDQKVKRDKLDIRNDFTIGLDNAFMSKVLKSECHASFKNHLHMSKYGAGFTLNV